MHPAGSVILFTVASGLGFGLLTWLGLGLPDVRGWLSFFYYALAFALAVGGLLASTFHLGNPQRFLSVMLSVKIPQVSAPAYTVKVLSVPFHVGAMVSSTVTTKKQVSVFPLGSKAKWNTVSMPTGKKVPEVSHILLCSSTFTHLLFYNCYLFR